MLCCATTRHSVILHYFKNDYTKFNQLKRKTHGSINHFTIAFHFLRNKKYS